MGTKPVIQSVDRALSILLAFDETVTELGVSELGRRTQLNKVTAYRLIQTLEARGFLRQNPETGRYRLGLTCWQLGTMAVRRDLREVSRRHLQELMERTQESVVLSVPDGFDVVYVERLESPQPVGSKSLVGRRAPAYCIASGKALLSTLLPAELDRLLPDHLPSLTPTTITDPERLRAELIQIHTQGYALNRGERQTDVSGLAAPIFDHTGRALAATGLSVPAMRMTDEAIDQWIPLVIQAAWAISLELGAPQ
jgi:IclR family KDG regulon transcriptional repressor